MKATAMFAAVLVLLGCGHASTEPVGPTPISPPLTLETPKPEPTTPTPAVAAVSSVNLADYCPQQHPQAGAAASRMAGDALVATSTCQIVLSVDGSPASRFQILSATLIDDSGRTVQSLSTGAPRIWRADAYQPWNEQLEGNGPANVLYSLSNLDWSQVPDSYRRTFRVQLEVAIDGNTTTLTSPETVREAMIVT